MAADKDRVLEFLRTTFFDNAAALECQRLTQDRAGLLRVGPGGVGQSLNACLIANLFGGMHDFMDMNVFYSEDELRKQADTFTGKVNIWGSHVFAISIMKTLVVLGFFCRIGQPCAPQVVITGQEAPSTEKRLREDLYMKVMSGDPVAARLPHAILTKMVTFSGWKRFEMNETLKFHGVTEMTFPSMMRRSLIINCKGRFVSAERLASLPSLPARRGTFSGHERFRDLTACSGCPVHCRPR